MALAAAVSGGNVGRGEDWGNLRGRFVYDGVPPKPEKAKITSDQQECDQHNLDVERMVVIRDTPYMAVTDENGQFEIPHLPVGTWQFMVWHEQAGYVDKVSVGGKSVSWSRGILEQTLEPGENDLETIVVGVGQGHHINRDLEAEPLAYYDAVLLGEPEIEFPNLLERIRREGPHAEAWRRHYRNLFECDHRFSVDDPDALPFPSYTPEELKAYRSLYPVPLPGRVVWGFLIATRGCPHACVFCSEVMRASTGRALRSRTAARVVDEMKTLADQGVTVCSFQDDSFTAHRRFVLELVDEMIRRGADMPWMARLRVDEVDRDLLAGMKEAGCCLLAYGVESGSQRVIERMGKQRRPEPWADLCRRVFRWTHEVGISTNAFYVIGNPTETRSEIEQTIALAMELDSDTIQVHFFTPYPGSIAWRELKDRLHGYDLRQMYHYARPLFSLAEVSVDELIELRRTFYRRYIFRWRFAQRHIRRYARFYWDNPGVLRDMIGIRKVM